MKKLILIALVCSALSSSASQYFGVKAIVNEPNCYGGSGSITLSVLGGTSPFQYVWTTSQGAPVTGNSPTQSSLPSGSYFVVVTDANNLTTSYTIVMAEPYQIQINTSTVNSNPNGPPSGSAQITVDGGTPDYTYLWSNNATTQNLSNISSGNYSVTVTDAVGCTSVASETVNTQPGAAFRGNAPQIRNATINNMNDRSLDNSGNGTGAKSSSSYGLSNNEGAKLTSEDVQIFPIPATNTLTVRTGDVSNAQITVYDINGQKVSTQLAESTETNINVSSLPTGSYIVEIKAEDGTVVNKKITVAK